MRAAFLATSFLCVLAAGAGRPARSDDVQPAGIVDCEGGAALVSGAGNRVVLKGACKRLDVTGSDNDVEADIADDAQVHVEGARNHVVLHPAATGGTPDIDSQGDANEVTLAAAADAPDAPAPTPAALAAPSPATPPPGALVLDGDGLSQVVRCGGRDVLIHGSDGRFRLTGGCRSVSVQGDGARIEAELMPGARVAIGGALVRLNYILTAPGPLPALSVSGRESQVRHVDHLSSILGPSTR